MLLSRFALPVSIWRSGSAMANAKLAKPVWNKTEAMDRTVAIVSIILNI
jgi:hypothetical protein